MQRTISQILTLKTGAILALTLISGSILPHAHAAGQQKLIASDRGSSDAFGKSLSLCGDYAIIGAENGENDGSVYNPGAAYIYQSTSSGWVQTSKLNASDAAKNDSFGSSVSIIGNYAIVGASGDDDNGSGSGSAYIYQLIGSTWTETAKLTASNGARSDKFGGSVSIYGNCAIVGAANNDSVGSNSGLAYIYQLSGSSWTEAAILQASDTEAGDKFGCSVSINDNRAIVGASDDDDDMGSAYIFDWDGSAWTQACKLMASDGAEDDRFGCSVDVDGDYAIVGSYLDDDIADRSGSAYIYHYDGSIWEEIAKLTASDPAELDRFGTSVSISGDYALVGADGVDGSATDSGSAYLFHREGSTWTQVDKILAYDGAEDDTFGCCVAMSGTNMLIGAPDDDDHAGAAYITSVPEPSSILALMTGAIGLIGFGINRKK